MSRAIPPSMDDSVVARIDGQLQNICEGHNVRIPLAIESGSRAWGFPSEDSDYDCRFIFVRPERSYLSLWDSRDVIETPTDEILDVNGWDLRKALKLLLKGNAVVIEWLTSPITYIEDSEFRAGFLELARKTIDRRLVGRHYLHLGERQRRTYFRDDKLVPLKKIFYALRPAAALRWLRYHPHDAVAPMHFPTLLSECYAPVDVSGIVTELIVRKARTREMGEAPLPEPICAFIDQEFELARESFEGDHRGAQENARELCDEFFVAVLDRLAPT